MSQVWKGLWGISPADLQGYEGFRVQYCVFKTSPENRHAFDLDGGFASASPELGAKWPQFRLC